MSSKPAVAVSNIIALIQKIAGGFLIFVFGVCTLSYIFDAEYRDRNEGDFLVFCLVSMFIGFMLFRAGRKRTKLAAEFKKYVSIISTEPTDSIARIADVSGRTMEEVTKNLEMMIKRNFFMNAHINYSEKCIVFGNSALQNSQIAQSLGMTQMPKIEYITVSCKYCAGVTEGIQGQQIQCKYCGMMLK